jgi:hypothetical protein
MNDNATSETAKSIAASGWNITLDVAALLNILLWAAVLLIVLLAYRKYILALVSGIASRISKLEFGGISIDLAKAKEFVPQWSEVGALDLRHKAQAVEVNDSYMMSFRTQLLEDGTRDYAEIDLGGGSEWLTSRLFIMAVVFARMKGIKSLVFLSTSGNQSKRFVCLADPQNVRWALAKRFPWLEQAYTDACTSLLGQDAIIVSNEGRLGTSLNHADPEPGISLIREFLARVQSNSVAAPAIPGEWVSISSSPNTYENARWLTGLEIEDILGPDCKKTSIVNDELTSKDTGNAIKQLLALPGRFVAVVTADQKFEYLIDRTLILERVARHLAFQNG